MRQTSQALPSRPEADGRRQITPRKSPPPGFEFVPIGNPELTSACKELSREKDAMIFIVSVRFVGPVLCGQSTAS